MKTNNLITNSEETEPSPKEIIKDLISLRKFLPGFLNLNKDYNDIVEYFLQLDLNDKDTTYPSVQGIHGKLGINYSTFKRKLLQLRQDILNHERFGINFSINQVEYVFVLEDYHKWERLIINDLPIVPRIGEQVRFPFLKETFGTEYFHVKKIDHYINDTKQSIEITLTPGEYNLFWHLKKDEEFEKGNISTEEYHSSSDYLLKDRFGLKHVFRFR